MTVDQKPREVFRIAKQRVEEKEDVVAVTCHKDESGAGESKWIIERKSGRSTWKR